MSATNLTPTGVPKVLHQVWIGKTPLPDSFKWMTERFFKIHPGWSYRLWTEETIPWPLVNQDIFDALAGAHISYRSDVIRYELLWQQGGLYADFDVYWHSSIEPWLQYNDNVMAFECPGSVNNGVFAVRPHHPFAAALVTELSYSFERYRNPHTAVGVGFFSRGVYSSHRHALHVLPKSLIHWGHSIGLVEPAAVVARKGSIASHWFSHARGAEYADRLRELTEACT